MQLDWILIGEILYLVVLMIVCLRVIYDTRSSTKTLAYLLLIIFIPIVGIFIYFSFGVNYRRKKMYSKKLLLDAALERPEAIPACNTSACGKREKAQFGLVAAPGVAERASFTFTPRSRSKAKLSCLSFLGSGGT